MPGSFYPSLIHRSPEPRFTIRDCSSLLIALALLFFSLSAFSPLQSQSLERGRSFYFKGEYDKAASALEGSRHSEESLVLLSRIIEEQGDLDRAKTQITQIRGWERFKQLLNRLGELEEAQSNYSQARKYYAQSFAIDSTYLEARLNLGILEARWGRKQRARHLLQYFIDLYKITPYPDARISFTTARACIYLNRFQDANDLFQDASKQSPDDWRIFEHWGQLFLDKFNYADAKATFRDAIKLNPNAVKARIGLAAASELDNPQEAAETVDSLMKSHPERTDVLIYAARWKLLIGERAEADKLARKALKNAPNNLEALSVLAQIDILEHEPKKFEASVRKVLDINPAYSKVYTDAGDALARRYLFAEAVELYRKAVAIDAEDAAAHNGLGTALSRLAKLEEAKPVLERAFELDSYNVWTANLLDLFDSYKEYDTLRTKHFLIRLHRDDTEIVGPYAMDLAEAAYRAIAPRYKFAADFPITIEIFPKHDDFAVRCFGLPGSQAFLGICFGPLITMNSPRARPVGSFNWSETLWHEFAHVVHLLLSKNRVPRWLAEGIAVYETSLANRAWDMNMHFAAIRALEKDGLIPLNELNSGFVGDPRRVTFSYYQASEMVAFIVERYGFDKLLDLLKSYRDGLETPQAIKQVLSLTPEAFDAGFKGYMRKKFLRDDVDFAWEVQDLPKEPGRLIERLRKIATDRPTSYFAHLYLGQALLSQKSYKEAISSLEKARSLFADDVTGENPYNGLTRAYLAIGDSAKALERLRVMVAKNGKDFKACLQLYELAAALQRPEVATEALIAAIQISPYNPNTHKQLGELFLQANQAAKALREFKVELALNPLDKAGAHTRIADAYLRTNQKVEAKRHALLALEIAPTYARAQEILLKSVQ